MNNHINSPAGYYQGPRHPGQPPQQVIIQAQNVPPQNPILATNIMPNQPADQFYPDANDGLTEPVQKSKELLNQLKISLQALMEQLVVLLNPSSETNSFQAENHYQLLGKHIENFNRSCDLLTVNLKVACEAQEISNELKNFSRYYAHKDQMDANRNENPFINSINIQMQRIGEIQNMMLQYLGSNNLNQTDN